MPDFREQRMPPHSLDAEAAVLGAVLLEGASLKIAAEIIAPSDFYKKAHESIFKAMLDMAILMTEIDLVTLPEFLRGKGELEKCGGAAYISTLVNIVPNAANVRYHCKIVLEKAILRKLIVASANILQKAYDDPGDVDEFLGEAERSIIEVTKRPDTVNAAPLREMSDVASSANDVSWIVAGIIPEGHITLIEAPKYSAKTFLALYLGVCIAAGTPAFPSYGMDGRPVSEGRAVKKRPVIYCDKENSDAILRPRLTRLGCPTGFKSWSYTRTPPPPRVDESGALTKWYLPLINDSDPKPVLVFDTLSKFHSAKSENDNREMGAVMACFKTLQSAGAAIVILHHAGYPPKGERLEKGRGAQAIGDDCDVEWMLDKSAKVKSSYLLRGVKNRLGEAETLHIKLAGNEHNLAFIDVGAEEEIPF